MTRALTSTYRLQLRPEFDLFAAAGVVPYLARLGIDCCYCSPVLEAVKGSSHGYDGVDPSRIRAELGGEGGLEALTAAVRAHGLGLVLDIVPNHLATDVHGPWWRDVLRYGRASRYGEVFDIDWDRGSAPGRVALPLLDRPLAQALADGLLALGEREGATVLLVGALDLPVRDVSDLDAPLAAILAQQHYVLVDWHDARERNYRRFFALDGLVGVRVELDGVFDLVHERIVALCRDGVVDALRVDHLDGLADPAGYLARLREATGGVPVIVEKILTGPEILDERWPVLGTTGYEVIDEIAGALADPEGLERLRRQVGADDARDSATIAAARREVLETALRGDLEHLAGRLAVAPERLATLALRLPRYRTYGGEPYEILEGAAGADTALVALLCLAENEPLLRRFEQLCAAVTAKGVEDTAWYRIGEPLALCEVGGDPLIDRHDGVARLHAGAAARLAGNSAGLLPGSTHDTKRSGDARARLLALAERPTAFDSGLAELAGSLGIDERLHAELRLVAELTLAIWPTDGDPAGDLRERVCAATVKSAREQSRRTSWTAPDAGFERRLTELVDVVFDDDAHHYRRALGDLGDEIAALGAVLSLSGLALRAVLPGVFDCFQGDETWNLALVDPDNRRLVEFEPLDRCLAELGAPDTADPGMADDLRRSWRDGRIKLHLTRRALRVRATLRPSDAYTALTAHGDVADSVFGAARGEAIYAIVTRTPGALDHDPGDLPHGAAYGESEVLVPSSGTYRNLVDGVVHDLAAARLDVASVLAHLPVALLVRE